MAEHTHHPSHPVSVALQAGSVPHKLCPHKVPPDVFRKTDLYCCTVQKSFLRTVSYLLTALYSPEAAYNHKQTPGSLSYKPYRL